jgi:hypothetical protein
VGGETRIKQGAARTEAYSTYVELLGQVFLGAIMHKTREQAFWRILCKGAAAMFALGFVGADLMAAATALG